MSQPITTITPANASDYTSISRLLHQLAYAEDTLDWPLFESCYTQTQPLQIDLSTHISSYSSNTTMTPADIAHTAHLALSGFDSTQHVVSNIVVDITNSINTIDTTTNSGSSVTTAHARAYTTATHNYSRPLTEGPSTLIVRGVWHIDCIKEPETQEWKVAGVKVTRLAASDGDEELYVLAKEKAERGEGRLALIERR